MTKGPESQFGESQEPLVRVALSASSSHELKRETLQINESVAAAIPNI
jgi:hypothetical protein